MNKGINKGLFIHLVVSIAVLFVLSGCAEFFPCDGRFYVKTVQPYSKGVYEYQMVSLTGENSFWMKDSANKYIVGDTVIVTPSASNFKP